MTRQSSNSRDLAATTQQGEGVGRLSPDERRVGAESSGPVDTATETTGNGPRRAGSIASVGMSRPEGAAGFPLKEILMTEAGWLRAGSAHRRKPAGPPSQREA